MCSSDLREIADYISYSADIAKKSITIMGSTKSRLYFGVELVASDRYMSAFRTTMKSLTNPLKMRLYENGYRSVDILMFDSADSIMVTVRL